MAKALLLVLVSWQSLASIGEGPAFLTPVWTKTLARGGRFLAAHDYG